MIKSIIKKSQLEGVLRLDAEYYQPEYLNIKRKLTGSPMLADIAKKITDFGAYSQMNFVKYEEFGITFFRNQNIEDVFIENSDQIFISPETYDKLSLKLEEFDILTPRVGTLGNAAIVLRDNLPASANQNLAQIKPDIKKIDPFYLTVFLCSYFGKKQFERFATGNVQPWLNLEQIKAIAVFLPPTDKQKIIREVIEESGQELRKSKNIYRQAEELLLEELGLKNFSEEEKLFSVVKLSEVKEVGRFDAEYFQVKYKKLIEKIKQNNAKSLGDLVTLKKGIEVGAEEYQEEGKIFIRVSSMTKFGIVESDQKYLSDKLYESLKNDFEPKKGEILLTKDATLGVTYVLKEDVKGIISGGTLRLKLKDMEVGGEYLALCLNSIVGQMQAERDAGGSIIAHWKPEQIKEVAIPILPKETQQKIAGLVRQSYEARKKAKELLEEAKRKVEEMIEKGTHE